MGICHLPGRGGGCPSHQGSLQFKHRGKNPDPALCRDQQHLAVSAGGLPGSPELASYLSNVRSQIQSSPLKNLPCQPQGLCAPGRVVCISRPKCPQLLACPGLTMRRPWYVLVRIPGAQAGVGPPPRLPADLHTTSQQRGAAHACLAPVSPNAVGGDWGTVEPLRTIESSHSITLPLNHRGSSQPEKPALRNGIILLSRGRKERATLLHCNGCCMIENAD